MRHIYIYIYLYMDCTSQDIEANSQHLASQWKQSQQIKLCLTARSNSNLGDTSNHNLRYLRHNQNSVLIIRVNLANLSTCSLHSFLQETSASLFPYWCRSAIVSRISETTGRLRVELSGHTLSCSALPKDKRIWMRTWGAAWQHNGDCILDRDDCGVIPRMGPNHYCWPPPRPGQGRTQAGHRLNAYCNRLLSIPEPYFAKKKWTDTGIWRIITFITFRWMWLINHAPTQTAIYTQRNLSVKTTSMIKFLTRDLFSDVFSWRLKAPIYPC